LPGRLFLFQCVFISFSVDQVSYNHVNFFIWKQYSVVMQPVGADTGMQCGSSELKLSLMQYAKKTARRDMHLVAALAGA
jgi:hypothetical protein